AAGVIFDQLKYDGAAVAGRDHLIAECQSGNAIGRSRKIAPILEAKTACASGTGVEKVQQRPDIRCRTHHRARVECAPRLAPVLVAALVAAVDHDDLGRKSRTAAGAETDAQRQFYFIEGHYLTLCPCCMMSAKSEPDCPSLE